MTAMIIVYALFDLFNNRNVPTVFAYGTLVLAALFTLSTGSVPVIEESGLIAIIILAIGYLMYKSGQLGAADVIEFAAISLFLPVQGIPLLVHAGYQYNIPFIVSVFISSGIAALILIPVYYLPRAWMILKKPLISYVSHKELPKAIFITAAYVAFILFLALVMHAGAALLLLIAIIMVSSMVTMLFEKAITGSMISFLVPRQLEDQDILAFNLMRKGEITEIKKKVKGFNKLVSTAMITEMKKKIPKRKLPVYRSAMPMALPILIGVVVSLLVGNVLLYLF
jgi:Flp pilus assembly protein protease CpaA